MYNYDIVNIKLNVELCDNSFFARYGVDIVINDTVIKTLLQGESYSTTIDVEKGNYTIKFVKNYSTSEEISNNKNVKSASATEEIVRDTSMNFTIQTHEKYIEITDYSVK